MTLMKLSALLPTALASETFCGRPCTGTAAESSALLPTAERNARVKATKLAVSDGVPEDEEHPFCSQSISRPSPRCVSRGLAAARTHYLSVFITLASCLAQALREAAVDQSELKALQP